MSNMICKSFDAHGWADEWVKTLTSSPGLPLDRRAMIGWFANALMAGHDQKSRECKAGLDRLQAALEGITISGYPNRVRTFLQALDDLGVTPPDRG